jgi:cytidylate kinase
MIIAIDGPAASGKGTIGRRLAQHYGLRYLDTGLLYRAVAKGLLDREMNLHSEQDAAKVASLLILEGLLSQTNELMNYGLEAAVVAAFPKVRTALLGLQREFANKPPGAVLDGRDIGTVVFPNADVKIFVDAAPEVRARRRASEFGGRVDEVNVLADIRRRDERDRTRPVSPLKPASDAHLLDTTHLDIDAAFRAAVDIVEAVRAGRGRG